MSKLFKNIGIVLDLEAASPCRVSLSLIAAPRSTEASLGAFVQEAPVGAEHRLCSLRPGPSDCKDPPPS